MPKPSAIDIAKSVVPEHVRGTAKVVGESPPSPPGAQPKAVAARVTMARKAAAPKIDIADRIAAKLGVKPKRASRGQSADVEFTEHTPLGKRSIVVQVRGGKVKQILKRA